MKNGCIAMMCTLRVAACGGEQRSCAGAAHDDVDDPDDHHSPVTYGDEVDAVGDSSANADGNSQMPHARRRDDAGDEPERRHDRDTAQTDCR